MRELMRTFSTFPQDLLHEFCERLEFGFEFLEFFLLVLILNVKALLGSALKLLAIELLELLHSVLVNRVHHVENLETFLAKSFEEGRGRDCSNALTGDVINVILTFFHAVDILLEADLLIARLGSVVTHEFCNLGTISRILMDAQFDVLRKLLIKLLVIILFLCDLREHLEALFHEILFDHTHALVLLQSLT